jgi:predicted dehydrogenase
LIGLKHPLEAVCDPRAGLADDLAKRFAFRSTFSDLPGMLRDANVQALIISRDAPNVGDIVDALLKCRLPFWVDAASHGLEQLIARLRRRKANNSPVYMICHPHRFGPAFLRAAELIRGGRLGELSLGSLKINSAKASPGQMELPLEYLLEGALDLLVSLLGEPEKVYASWDGISTLAGIIHFDQKPLALQLRQGVWQGQSEHCLRLYGQQDRELCVKGLVDLSAAEGEAVLARSVGGAVSSSPDVCAQHGWTGALARFFAAVGRKIEDCGDLTGYLRTQKLREAVIRSAEGPREVGLRI